LLTNGRAPETPVALIRWGTTEAQETVTGTLGDIVERAERAGLTPPVLAVIGPVVGLRDRLDWFGAPRGLPARLLAEAPWAAPPGRGRRLGSAASRKFDRSTRRRLPLARLAMKTPLIAAALLLLVAGGASAQSTAPGPAPGPKAGGSIDLQYKQ